MDVDIFNKLAITTWDAIGNAFFNKISFGEDAVTSINLLNLKNSSLPNLVVADTRPTESTKGCDFEFWIGNDHSGWYRYAIQAKKLAVSKENYQSLNHKVGSEFQINILERYAKSNRAIPLYCLYNYSQSTKVPLNSCNIDSSCIKYSNIKELGCSISPLATTNLSLQTRGARTFDWFHSRNDTLPWSCLVRCLNIGKNLSERYYGIKNQSEIMYSELPRVLRLLISNETVSFKNSDIFSQEVELRPKWIGVVQTEKHQIMG